MKANDLNWIETRVLHWLTEHDRRECQKRGYNPYALGIYCQALESWKHDPDTSSEPLKTLTRYFTTHRDDGKNFSIRLLDKAVQEIIAKYPTLSL